MPNLLPYLDDLLIYSEAHPTLGDIDYSSRSRLSYALATFVIGTNHNVFVTGNSHDRTFHGYLFSEDDDDLGRRGGFTVQENGAIWGNLNDVFQTHLDVALYCELALGEFDAISEGYIIDVEDDVLEDYGMILAHNVASELAK